MYLIQTVQTSWRPQLPLPKEPDGDSSSTDEQDAASTIASNDMEQRAQHHGNSRKENYPNATHTSSMNHTTPTAATKKWSFGRLFRRKKDIASDSSSEEDRKAGFTPTHRNSRATSGSSANLKTKSNKTNKLSRSSKLNGASFDHIVLHPQTGAPITPPHPPAPHADNEFFLPVETISPSESYYQNQHQYLQHGATPGAAAYTRSANSLDRRAARAAYKTRSAQRLPHDATGAPPRSSSEEEIISLNSSTFSKYRSDESIHSGGQGAANNMQSKRSRAARNERYYKRLSRDGEPSNGQVPVMYAPQPTPHQRWKTQPVPLSIYNPAAQAHNTPRLRNTSSLQHVAPYVQWGQLQQQQQQQPKNLQNSVNDAKRSISYDSHIHLQNINGRMQTKPLPPPPPPRDPLRRVNVSGQMQNGSSAGDLRPISYAFDQSGLPVVPATNTRLSSRCVSDDKIWSGPIGPHYQSVHSLNTPPMSVQHEQQAAQHQAGSTPHHRRFITRAERDAQPGKKSLPNGLEFHYVADATPRSRKPIHMLEPQHDAAAKEQSGVGILRTTKSGLASPSTPRGATDFWQRMDAGVAQQRGRATHAAEVHAKPRSISSSRVGELRAYPIPLYSEVQKPKREPQASPFATSSGVDEVDNIVCGSLHIKSKPDTANANYVEIRNKDYSKSNSMPNHYQRRSGEIPNTPNKYDEYVAEKREQHHKPIYSTPTPPQRKLSIPPSQVPPELPIYFPRKKPANLEEAINELEAIYKSLGLTEPPEQKERVPTPSEFEKYALARAAEFDDDEDSPTGEPDPIRDDVAYRNMQLANLQHKTAEKQPPFGIPVGPVVAAPQTDYLHVTPIVEPPQRQAPDIVKDDLAVRALRKDPQGPKDKFNYPYSSFQQQKKNRATRTQSANIYNLIHRDAAKPSGGDLQSYLELTRNLERAGSMSELHNKGGDEVRGERASDVPATLALLRNLKQQEQELATPTKKAPIPFRHPSQGGAISALPEKLPNQSSAHKEEVQKPPVPLPRKSLTPEPTAANAQMEDALNKIAKEAQEKSMKLTKELQELRKEALITSSRPKAIAKPNSTNAEEARLEKDLQEIEAVSEAAKRCGKMLLDTLPDANETQAEAKPRKLHKEGKLIQAIDQVSEAANAVCEKILKDIVTTEPPVVIQEAVKVKNKPSASTSVSSESLVTPNLIKKLDPIQSERVEAIAKRCMRQLSELAEDNPDYDNLNQEMKQREQEQLEREQQQRAQHGSPQNHARAATAIACNAEHIHLSSTPKVDNSVSTLTEAGRTKLAAKPQQNVEEIDQIMEECEAKMRAGHAYAPTVAPPPLPLPAPVINAKLAAVRLMSSSDDHTTAPSITTTTNNSSCSSAAAVGGKPGASTTASSFSSSSDCLAKSSSPSAGRRQSSSITSFNPYSSSDYVKSPTSSDYHTPSTDPIKTFSTTSYDAQTTTSAATPNISATTFSYTPSPPPPLTITGVGNERVDADTCSSALVASDVAALAAAATRQSQERLRARSLSTPSQYNSSEELAMIFGIDEQPRRMRAASQQAPVEMPPTNVTGKNVVSKSIHACASPPVPLLSSSNHATARHATKLATSNSNASQLTTNTQALVDVAKQACECVVPANSTTNSSKRLRHAIVNHNDVVDVTPASSSTISINNPTIIPSFTINKNSCSSLSLSPNSCKLESIPESQGENASRSSAIPLKLSPNFNKIYASKISIVVDNVKEEARRNARQTQCDSLSSCEDETSSNPDSGNVSLADFPLSAQTNNVCLQFENACNSRYEIKKKSFVNEVCITPRIENELEETRTQELEATLVMEEFPPPPSEKELLDSLVEEIIEIAVDEINECVDDESARGEEERQALKDETPESAKLLEEKSLMKKEDFTMGLKCTEEETTGTKVSNSVKHSITDGDLTAQTQNNSTAIQKSNSTHEVDDTRLIQLAQLVRSSDSRRNSTSSTELYTTETPESMPQDNATNTANENASSISARIHTDLEHLRLAFNELLERNLNETDELPSIVEEEEEEDEKEFAENTLRCATSTEALRAPSRKQSIVIETPPLNLNISEVKISFPAGDETESNLCDQLTQSTNSSGDEGQIDESPSKSAKSKGGAHNNMLSTESQLLPWRRRSSTNNAIDDNEPYDNYQRDDEKPSTSAAAAAYAPQKYSRELSIFGELRPAAVAAAAVTGGFTTLEHVLLACSLGVITPTDLYTLCLIIVGMITLIALVLF